MQDDQILPNDKSSLTPPEKRPEEQTNADSGVQCSALLGHITRNGENLVITNVGPNHPPPIVVSIKAMREILNQSEAELNCLRHED